MMLIALILTCLGAACLCASLIILAPRKAGYRHARHTISEIGEVGSPVQGVVAFGLFLPIGLLLLLVAWFVLQASPPVAALALCIALGYLGAAVFPCDAGSPVSGSARQGIHNLCGAVEYIGGGLALMAIAERFGQPFKVAGFIVIGTAIALTVLPSTAFRGLIQRVGETTLFGALALAIWRASSYG